MSGRQTRRPASLIGPEPERKGSLVAPLSCGAAAKRDPAPRHPTHGERENHCRTSTSRAPNLLQHNGSPVFWRDRPLPVPVNKVAVCTTLEGFTALQNRLGFGGKKTW